MSVRRGFSAVGWTRRGSDSMNAGGRRVGSSGWPAGFQESALNRISRRDGPPGKRGFPLGAAGFPPGAASFPFRAADFPPGSVGFPFRSACFPPGVADFPMRAARFPSGAAGFPLRAASFPPGAAGRSPGATDLPTGTAGRPPVSAVPAETAAICPPDSNEVSESPADGSAQLNLPSNLSRSPPPQPSYIVFSTISLWKGDRR